MFQVDDSFFPTKKPPNVCIWENIWYNRNITYFPSGRTLAPGDMYIYLEPVCPLFWGLNPPKEGPFHSKQGSFGFQIYNIYIYIWNPTDLYFWRSTLQNNAFSNKTRIIWALGILYIEINLIVYTYMLYTAYTYNDYIYLYYVYISVVYPYNTHILYIILFKNK